MEHPPMRAVGRAQFDHVSQRFIIFGICFRQQLYGANLGPVAILWPWKPLSFLTYRVEYLNLPKLDPWFLNLNILIQTHTQEIQIVFLQMWRAWDSNPRACSCSVKGQFKVVKHGGGIRLIVGFQPLMVISPTASWIRWCMQVFAWWFNVDLSCLGRTIYARRFLGAKPPIQFLHRWAERNLYWLRAAQSVA